MSLAHPDAVAARPALALNVELSHGRPGASARVELHERAAGDGGRPLGASRLARVALRGCIDAVATRRLARLLDDLVARGAEHVLVDCAELRHIDFRMVPALVAAFEAIEARSGGVVLRGLSRYLRDVFRMAGCEPDLRRWPSAADRFATSTCAPEPGRERTS